MDLDGAPVDKRAALADIPDHSKTRPARSPMWAVGGGKGGTGKTFISAALAGQLARHNIPVNLVDADFGAPNLHTFLGVEEPRHNLADFFYGKNLPLEDVLIEVEGPSLRLAAGSSRRFNLARLEYFRRQKLIRQLKTLRGQIIIDTGAGTALNSIDFFNLSDLPILVANANPASMENLFLFLEAVTLRILTQKIRRKGLQEAFQKSWKSAGKPLASVPGIFEFVRSLGGGREEQLRAALDRFQPCLIVNKTRRDDEVLLGRCIVDVAKRCLGTRVHYVGAVPFDRRVEDCLIRFSPFVSSHPDSQTAVAVMLIMDRLLEHANLRKKAQ